MLTAISFDVQTTNSLQESRRDCDEGTYLNPQNKSYTTVKPGLVSTRCSSTHPGPSPAVLIPKTLGRTRITFLQQFIRLRDSEQDVPAASITEFMNQV